MSTITKPVILDETGQSIATYLSGIKTAIENQSTSLNNLSDVNVSGATNGQTINYDSATGKWVNGNVGLGDMMTSTYDDDDAVAQAGGIADYVDAAYDAEKGIVKSNGKFKADLKSETLSSLTAGSRGEIAGREYPVGLDANGDLSVNVPWSAGTFSVSGKTLTYNV